MTDTTIEVVDLVLPVAGAALALRVHRRAGAGPQPGVVCAGSWLTVKEQMSDVYAGRLAAKGFTAVSFDFTGFGASGGSLRQTEVPAQKMRDLAAVVDAVSDWSWVVTGSTGVVAVCASAQYTLGALRRGLPIAWFAAVAGWFHDAASVAPFYGGEDGVREKLQQASAAARRYTETGELNTVAAYAPGDPAAGMSMEMDYYGNPARGAVPTWTNEMSLLSWPHWLGYDVFHQIDVPGGSDALARTVPTLLVHSDDAVLPDNARAVADRLGEAATLVWTSGEQTDFYDRPAQVGTAVAAVVDHARTVLEGRWTP